MHLKPKLLRWQLAEIRPITNVALLVAVPWALFTPKSGTFLAFVFVAIHSFALVACLGRFRSGAFGFLYNRGYTRDALWGHTMLTTAIGVLWVWLPVALVLWLPIRSWVQEWLFQHPDYPLMWSRDLMLPWMWLKTYAFLLPLLHYAWIRQAQPAKYSDDGIWLVAGAVWVSISLLGPARDSSSTWITLAGHSFYVLVPVTALVVGWQLHHDVEVQS